MLCDYKRLPDGRWRCDACGDETSRCRDAAPNRECDRAYGHVPQAPTTRPGLLKRLTNFSKAAIAHELAGAPTCTQEQINQRHAVCMSCEVYIPSPDNPAIGTCGHNDCGCPIVQADRYVSKLAWADQECPLKKWPRLA